MFNYSRDKVSPSQKDCLRVVPQTMITQRGPMFGTRGIYYHKLNTIVNNCKSGPINAGKAGQCVPSQPNEWISAVTKWT